MATVEDLIKRYETDKDLQAEVAEILKDHKVTIPEFVEFAKKHDVEISLDQMPKYLDQLRKAGLIN